MLKSTRHLILAGLLAFIPVSGSIAAQDAAPQELKPAPLAAEKLDLLADPSVRAMIAASYLAESDIEPRVTEPERVIMAEVLELIGTEQTTAAMERLRKEIEAAPNANALFDFTLANILFQQEKLEEAAPAYEKAVEKFPKFRRAWKNLALIRVRQSQFQQAVPALVRVISLGGGDATTYGLLGYSYSSVEDYLAAETAYRMAIMLDPATMDWKLGLARAFFKQERYAEAVALTNKLIEDNRERVDLWLLQANAYIGLNEPAEASRVYEIVDLLGGSTPESLNTLADIYTNQELYELAGATYVRAMELDKSGKPDRAIRAAKVLAARSAFAETRLVIESLEKIYGDKLDTEARKDLLKLSARLAVAQGASEEEVKVLMEIVELDPLDGEALILLGQQSARSGDNEKAIFYYERAAAIEKFEADAKVRHAQLLVGAGKYDEALPLLRRAQQINFRENIQEYLNQVEKAAKSR